MSAPGIDHRKSARSKFPLPTSASASIAAEFDPPPCAKTTVLFPIPLPKQCKWSLSSTPLASIE
eukprot:1633928-Rhodomonas_salina.5